MYRAMSASRAGSSWLPAVAAVATAASVGLSGLAIGAAVLSRAASPGASGARVASPITAANGRQALGQIALRFEPNVGQTDASVGFLTHVGGATVFLSPTRVVWAAVAAQRPAAVPAAHAAAQASLSGNALEMTLVGGSPTAAATTSGMQSGVDNYLSGSDAARWHTDVPAFAEVTFHDVYPGIDMAWYGDQGRLEYDFIVAPGADPSVIDMAFAGAGPASVDRQTGDLLLPTSIGVARQHAPQASQYIEGLRTSVAAGFTLTGGDRARFRLGAYDRSRPLDIDPVFGYSTLVGGTGFDQTWGGVAVDASGDAYISGLTFSTDYPTTPGAFQTTPGSVFVTELNPTGTGLVYSTYIGAGGGVSQPYDTVVDAHGDAFITGATSDTTFPATSGAFQTVCPQAPRTTCAFVVELASGGSSLVYSTFLSGTSTNNQSQGFGLAIDKRGDAYMSGSIGGSDPFDFPTTPGAYDTTCASCPVGQFGAGVVTELNQSGSALVYSTYLPGAPFNKIALDASGSAYVSGQTDPAPSTLPTTPGALQTTCVSDGCDFVTKFTPDGSALVYSTFLAGTQPATRTTTNGTGIAVDGSGDAYVAGTTDASDFPVTPGAYQPVLGPSGACGFTCSDGFVTKLNPSGSGLLYSTYYGGNGNDSMDALAIDRSGDVWVTGESFDSQLHSKDPLQEICTCFVFDRFASTFVAKIRPAGLGAKDLLFGTYLGGTSINVGREALAVDRRGDVYLSGSTDAPLASFLPPGTAPIPFPTTPGAFQTAQAPGKPDVQWSAFVTKFSQVCSVPLTGTITGNVVIGSGSAGCLMGAKVSGSVTVQPGGDLSIDNSAIAGSVTAQGASSVTICASKVGAGVSVAATRGFVRVGSGDAPGCNVNRITGDVTVKNNRGGFEIGGDIVTGSITVRGNTGSSPAYDDTVPEVESNHVSANLVCTANTPAPIDDLLPNRAATKSGQCAAL